MAHLSKVKSTINSYTKGFSVLSLVLLTVLSVGCSGSRKLGSGKQEFEPAVLNTFFNQLQVIEMKGKLKLTMAENGTSYNANLTIREKDGKIWFIVRFLGIEFFRGLIDQQNIQVLDRNNKEHLSVTWDEIQQKLNKDLSYETFRNLLLGNPFLVKGANYGYFKKDGVYEYDYTSDASQLLISILFNKRIKQSTWVLENDKIAIEANYDHYDSPNLKNIPYFRQYIVYFHNTQPINIQMEIKNYSFDDSITIPFEIPDRYAHSGLLTK